MDSLHNLPLLLTIAFAWAVYGALHSWLADAGVKQYISVRWPAFRPAYRLIFNTLAILLLIPPLWLTWRYPGAPLWHVPGWLAWPAAGISVAGYLWSMRWYDGMDFVGLRQWRSRKSATHWQDRLILSPLHRFVRHPWYSLGLLFIWTRDLNAGWLVACMAISAYLVMGSRLEEIKLIEDFGESYRRYRDRVPSLVPLPWRYLSQAEAGELLTLSAKNQAADSSSS